MNEESNELNVFGFFRDYYEYLAEMPRADAEKMAMALLDYAFTGKDTKFEGLLEPIYKGIKRGIDKSKNLSKNARKKSEKVAMESSQKENKTKSIENQNEINSKSIENQNENPSISLSLSNISISKSLSNKTLEKRGVGEETFNRIVEAWNGIGLAEVRTLSKTRKDKIRLRVKELGADKVIEAIERIPCSKFLMGDNKQGWKCSFDWLFTNDSNIVKVLEGNYEDSMASKLNQLGNPFVKLGVEEMLKGENR